MFLEEFDDIFELSHVMIPGNEIFKFELENFQVSEYLPDIKYQQEDWYILSEITMCSHVGTHIEFPYHYVEDGSDAAEYPFKRCLGEGVVLDFSGKAAGEKITEKEVKEITGGSIEEDIIFIRTDMDKYYRTEDWIKQPYLSVDAMNWVIEQKPQIVGTDAAGFEDLEADTQPNHDRMFKSNIAMVESVTNLEKLDNDNDNFVIMLPLPMEKADASPVRIIALVKE